ncbi:hypothetical protein SODALDRAFT_327141 [Sodiomyces alkalinus F11]|uniref:Ribosomal protein S21 n=1 Tax=Sodiomyces alkalinus (strain CBS 110278 / VKM F-3762 / F11) TaxID=1314773 RepID=A0A3N2Q879_SODAK|nr:hypothetical protein SODALDRAFT_327141 [Sodiomyces alkalinus F11]ROT42979.1 hypothetical protein SODALDRAFT_327141 [Sodiomyces alkalinus F11]
MRTPFSPTSLPSSRFLTTTSPLLNPRDVLRPSSNHPKPTWASRTNPSPNASTPTSTLPTPPPPPPPLSGKTSGSNALEKAAATDHVYDATSDTFDLSKMIADESAAFMRTHYTDRPQTEMRLKPVLGRTVKVTNNMDMAGALKQLDRVCKANRLYRYTQMQRFHERPGLKRKRLKSERWRARFKVGFVAAVKRVQELKKQGW